jgi:hypothetical protein
MVVIGGGWLVVASPVFDTPERHVARYLSATSLGDANAAMEEWTVFVSATDARFHAPDELVQRRRNLTSDLATNRVGRDFQITAIDWWTTCCDPRPTTKDNAGLARVHVTTSGNDGRSRRLVFEVWVKDLVWWGSAGGEWLHDWRLYEVHGEDEPCVFPSTAYGCIRAVG